MFADAFRSEAYRLLRNRTTVFWAFLFVPLIALVASVAQTLILRQTQDPQMLSGWPVLHNSVDEFVMTLSGALWDGADSLSNPALLLFPIVAAATIFASDYRWETWRLISARNSRTNLILAKVGVLAAGVGAGLLIHLASTLFGKALQGLVFGWPFSFSVSGVELTQAGALFGLAWLTIMQFLLVSLLAAVVTRSLLAALFIPLVVGIGQAALAGIIGAAGLSPDSWLAALLFPGPDIEALRAMLRGGQSDVAIPLLKAWTGVALWTLGPIAMALAWFQRQNLSKE